MQKIREWLKNNKCQFEVAISAGDTILRVRRLIDSEVFYLADTILYCGKSCTISLFCGDNIHVQLIDGGPGSNKKIKTPINNIINEL